MSPCRSELSAVRPRPGRFFVKVPTCSFRRKCGPSKLNNVFRLFREIRFRIAPVSLTSKVSLRRSPCFAGLLRKEVIQPHLPIRLPCYDFTPIIEPTFDRALFAVRLRASGVPDSHGVTGGVYKARERIHRGMLIRDY